LGSELDDKTLKPDRVKSSRNLSTVQDYQHGLSKLMKRLHPDSNNISKDLCWKWPGKLDLGGYGQSSVFSKQYRTHVLMFLCTHQLSKLPECQEIDAGKNWGHVEVDDECMSDENKEEMADSGVHAACEGSSEEDGGEEHGDEQPSKRAKLS
jgi:hypothetical protein